MEQPESFVEDQDLRKLILEVLASKLRLIEKENLTPLGINIQTGRLKLEL
jgi:hypothetical protein